MNDLTQLNTGSECKVDDIATNLYNRIQEETEKILKSQLEKLGYDFDEKIGSAYYDWESINGLQRTTFPISDNKLAVYLYNDQPILEIRISDNQMGIEFITPEIQGDS